jgi:hypothetical protein
MAATSCLLANFDFTVAMEISKSSPAGWFDVWVDAHAVAANVGWGCGFVCGFVCSY